MRTHAEWNVETHMIRARRPTSSSTRSRISAAALLVNVMARIEPGCALRSAISQAIRRVSTRVLPEPAPATTRSGVPACTTAARCGSLSPSSSSSGDGVDRPRGADGAAPSGPPDPSRLPGPPRLPSSSSAWLEVGAWGIGNDALMSGPAYDPAGTFPRPPQRPVAEKCMRSETVLKSPPQVQPTASKARTATPPGSTIPGRCQVRSS